MKTIINERLLLIYNHPVDLDHPDHGIVAQAAGQSPVDIQPSDAEHSPDSLLEQHEVAGVFPEVL